jgi:hypothetical protein
LTRCGRRVRGRGRVDVLEAWEAAN